MNYRDVACPNCGQVYAVGYSDVPHSVENILMEEVAEAFNVYQHGDKEHALQELAQCGAVIIRMMEFVEGEG